LVTSKKDQWADLFTPHLGGARVNEKLKGKRPFRRGFQNFSRQTGGDVPIRAVEGGLKPEEPFIMKVSFFFSGRIIEKRAGSRLYHKTVTAVSLIIRRKKKGHERLPERESCYCWGKWCMGETAHRGVGEKYGNTTRRNPENRF